MGHAVVLPELHSLRIHEDQADVVGRGPHQQRRHDRVDARGLPGAGRTGDQHVGELGEIEHAGCSADVHSEPDGERMPLRFRLRAPEDVAERDESPLAVGDLHADGALPGDRHEEPHVGGGEGIGDVVGQVRHPVDLHPRRQLDLEPGHGGARHDPGEGGVDAVLVECLLEGSRGLLETPPVVLLPASEIQEIERRQAVSVGDRGRRDRRRRLRLRVGRSLLRRRLLRGCGIRLRLRLGCGAARHRDPAGTDGCTTRTGARRSHRSRERAGGADQLPGGNEQLPHRCPRDHEHTHRHDRRQDDEGSCRPEHPAEREGEQRPDGPAPLDDEVDGGRQGHGPGEEVEDGERADIHHDRPDRGSGGGVRSPSEGEHRADSGEEHGEEEGPDAEEKAEAGVEESPDGSGLPEEGEDHEHRGHDEHQTPDVIRLSAESVPQEGPDRGQRQTRFRLLGCPPARR